MIKRIIFYSILGAVLIFAGVKVKSELDFQGCVADGGDVRYVFRDLVLNPYDYAQIKVYARALWQSSNKTVVVQGDSIRISENARNRDFRKLAVKECLPKKK